MGVDIVVGLGNDQDPHKQEYKLLHKHPKPSLTQVELSVDEKGFVLLLDSDSHS